MNTTEEREELRMTLAAKMITLTMMILSAASCAGQTGKTSPADTAEITSLVNDIVTEAAAAQTTEREDTGTMPELAVNGKKITVEWEDNESVKALAELAGKDGITVDMSMYGGFEQVGSLGQSIKRNDKQTTTSPGDIVLYSGNSIVVFYGSNSWSYTRLGKITGMTESELAELLGNGNVTLTITAAGR